MTKYLYKNEQLKREFFQFLDGREGFTERSINDYARAMNQWLEFTNNDYLYHFNRDVAVRFKQWLKTRKSKGRTATLSITTQDNYIRRVRKFFEWLVDENNKKYKLSKNDVKYLRLSNEEQRMLRNKPKRIPTLAEAKKLFDSIPTSTETDKRDKALISLMITTGMRVSALSTLSLKNFNEEPLCIYQDPLNGVLTKNKKYIETTFLPMIWKEPREYFIYWINYLKEKGFRHNDPIFPSFSHTTSIQELSLSSSIKPLNGSRAVGQILKKLCLQAQIPYYNPHSFRDLFSNIICEEKLSPMELKALSLILGHSRITTTLETYGANREMSYAEAVKIVNAMNDILTEKPEIILSTEERKTLQNLLDRTS